MEWSFQFPVKISFDVEAFAAIGAQVGNRRALLVATEGFRRRGNEARLAAALGSRLAGVVTGVKSNPDVEGMVQLCQASLRHEFDVVVAVGGGSVIDAAKVLAAGRGSWAREAATLRKFLSGGGKVGSGPVLPLIAVPTTSGTGSEVTPFATVWDNQQHKKFSVDGIALFPEAAIVDPRLTRGLPEDQTIATGLDAVSQALESIWNKRANPMTLAVATQSLTHSLGALARLAANPADDEARRPMALGSLLAGIAISQTRTGIAHSISYPLTARHGLVHGIACSFTLPAVLEFNLRGDDGRFGQLANALGLTHPVELIEKLEALLAACNVRERLRACIPSDDAILALCADMFTPGRADNNLVPVDHAIIENLLRASLQGCQLLNGRA